MNRTRIEALESRIAPASVSVTYTDIDGDLVKITASKAGAAAPLTADDLHFLDGDPDGQLSELTLTEAGFAGASIVFSVTKKPGGDGLAHAGFINAAGIDLGAVTIKGDLGRIIAGDATTATPGLAALTAVSIGRFGADTQAPGGNLATMVTGTFSKLTVTGDVASASIRVLGGSTDGKLGSLTIGGSLIGGTADSAGFINVNGDIGPVLIKGDVLGGSGNSAGRILAGGKLASLTVGGSLQGGTNILSGNIMANGDIGAVKIGRDVVGSSGDKSGSIQTETGAIASVTIGGSLRGGSNANTGAIYAQTDLGPVKIAGDVMGGSDVLSGTIFAASGTLTSVTIKGSLVGGSDSDTGEIYANLDLGPVKIGGDMIGGAGNLSGLIRSNTKGVASVTIGGSLRGGSNSDSGEIAAGTDLGPVKIGRDVVGGSGSVSGVIRSLNAAVASVKIGGNLEGGSASNSGVIFAKTELKSVQIAGDFKGGSTAGTAPTLFGSGAINSDGRIGSIVIGGSILAGRDDSTVGSLTSNATISAGDNLDSLKVGGGIVGTHGPNGDVIPIIAARGQETPGATLDLAIGSITVGGRVELAQILAGYDDSFGGTPGATNGDASIGKVKISGAWIASNLVAGATDGGNGRFGDVGDASIGAGNPNLFATIASITIGGIVAGTPDAVSSTDHFGFVAQKIGSFKAGGLIAVLTSATDAPLELSLPTGDVTLREVS